MLPCSQQYILRSWTVIYKDKFGVSQRTLCASIRDNTDKLFFLIVAYGVLCKVQTESIYKIVSEMQHCIPFALLHCVLLPTINRTYVYMLIAQHFCPVLTNFGFS